MSEVTYSFPKLGQFLESIMHRFKITKASVLATEHVGADNYLSLKKGGI